MDNNINEYRNIRYQRTYRTIGKMSWWRIVLGIVLIVFVIFLSGWPSQMLAARGKFIAAEKAMISPEWMEDYKPDTKAFIEAGVLYENGEYEAASAAFSEISNIDAASTMKNAAELRVALESYADEKLDICYDAFSSIDPAELNEDDLQSYNELAELLNTKSDE